MEDKMKEQLVGELAELPQQVSELQRPGTRLMWAKGQIDQHAAFLDLILESIPNPFYVIDISDYTIKLANSAAQFAPYQKTRPVMLLHIKAIGHVVQQNIPARFRK